MHIANIVLPELLYGAGGIFCSGALTYRNQQEGAEKVQQTYELYNRVLIPRAGLDLREMDDEPGRELIEAAIALGWRLFCVRPGSRTALALGRAVKESGLPRTAFFLITSLAADLGTYSAASAEVQFEISLLGQFLDAAVADAENLAVVVPQDVEELWRVLEGAMAQGKVRSLGIHGFTAPQVECLCADMALAPQILLGNPEELTADLLACVRHYSIQLLVPCTEDEAPAHLAQKSTVLLHPDPEAPVDWVNQIILPGEPGLFSE